MYIVAKTLSGELKQEFKFRINFEFGKKWSEFKVQNKSKLKSCVQVPSNFPPNIDLN